MKTGGRIIETYFADTGQRVYLNNRKRSVAKGIEKYSAAFFTALVIALKATKKIKGRKLRMHSIDTFVQTFRNIDLPRKVTIRERKSTITKPKVMNVNKLGKSIDQRPE